MTEEEAKTKWCCGPPMNIMAAGIASGKRELGAGDGQCVASARMAWRVKTNDPKVEYYYAAPKPPGEGWTEYTDPYLGSSSSLQQQAKPKWVRTTPAPLDGFCGLAGASQ